MPANQRVEKIESYGNAYDRLAEAVQQFPREMWQYRPSPDEWTIHEILIHITDSEANSYTRCRRLIAEPGENILGYDENGWAKKLDYHEQSVEYAMELFKWLRGSSYQLVRSLPEDVWSHSGVHTEDGKTTLDDWLNTYEKHIPDHIAQMHAVHKAWSETS